MVQEGLNLGILGHSTVLEAIRLGKRVTRLVRTKSGQTFMPTSTPVFNTDGSIRLVFSHPRRKEHIDHFLSALMAGHPAEKVPFCAALHPSILSWRSIHQKDRPIAESPAMQRILFPRYGFISTVYWGCARRRCVVRARAALSIET